MSKLVRDVVQLDHQAQEQLQKLYKEKEELSFELSKKRLDMEEDYQKEIKEIYIERLLELTNRMNKSEMNIKNKEKDLITQLRQQYELHEEKWLETILDMLMGSER